MTDIASMKMTPRHYYIVFVASLGQMIGTAVSTLAGIIIPILNIVLHPELSSFMQGLIGAADLIGIIFGSIFFGRLSDRYGYLFFFRFCPAVVCIASIIGIIFPSVTSLIICLFIIGLGIGGEYSLDSDYVSELMPSRYRSLMVGVTKAACAFGNIIVAAICLGLLSYWKSGDSWQHLLWIIAIMSALMLILRLRFYQSPQWLINKGRIAEAEKAAKRFFGQEATIENAKNETKTTGTCKISTWKFIKSNWQKVIFSGIPWACEGMGVYGIGVFLPILIMALGLEHFNPLENPILHVTDSVRITLWISCIILPAFVIGLILINKGRSIVKTQSFGFWMCAISLTVLLLSYHFSWNKWISIGAFMAFELFLNIGPHLITYILPPQIYPVSQRGQGVGLAASIGKIGAVFGVFIIPILLKSCGATTVLAVSAIAMVTGGIITTSFAKAAYRSSAPSDAQ